MTDQTHQPQHPYDSITIDSLVAKGSCKWSTYPGTLGAWTAEMDFGVAPAIRQVLTQVNDRDLFGYAPPALTRDMAQATATFYHQRYGWALNPDWVAPVSDVLTALTAVLKFYVTPGTPIILPTPAYMPFLTLPHLHGYPLIEVPMQRTGGTWRMDFDALSNAFAEAVATPSTPPTPSVGATNRPLLVLCNPHNPIGRVYTRDELTTLSELVERYQARVFSDEIHAPLTFDGHAHIPYASLNEATANHTITATSHSKSFNTPGLKCAQLIFSNEADYAHWKTHGTFVEKSASNPGLLAAVAAYRDSASWLADTIAYIQRNRDAMPALLAEHLPKAGYIPPEGTYLAWLDLTEYNLADNLHAFFAERARVSITDGALCGQAGRGHVRVNMGTPLPILTEVIRRMGEVTRS